MLMIGYILAFFTERKQALHDLLAGTIVLKNSGYNNSTLSAEMRAVRRQD
ncbi:hypothetical protein QKW52_27620 [Bacillus sonorensis]|nr:hypothetical protein [Bacillus sonorensis]